MPALIGVAVVVPVKVDVNVNVTSILGVIVYVNSLYLFVPVYAVTRFVNVILATCLPTTISIEV